MPHALYFYGQVCLFEILLGLLLDYICLRKLQYLIIIIIIIIIISFMQGIYTYIPETNCVPREYSVTAILLLLFMVLISLVAVLNILYFYISTFWRQYVCSAQYGCFL